MPEHPAAVPGGPRVSWPQRVFAVVALAVGLFSLATLPSSYSTHRAMRGADVCSPAPTAPQADPTCLVPVEGAVDDVRGDSGRGRGLRWHFAPADEAFEGHWVRFRGDVVEEDRTDAMDHLFAGRPVTALYWGDEPVAFETPAGRVESNRFAGDAWTALLWVGLAGLSLAAMAPLTAAARRRGGVPTIAGNAALMTPVAVTVGAIAAVFPDTFPGQLRVFAVVAAGLVGTAVLAAAVRARRR